MTREFISFLPVLVIDDEVPALISAEMALATAGIDNVLTCSDASKAMQLIRENEPGVVLLDLSMPRVSGMDLLARITDDYPELPVIIVTGANEVETAVDSMKSGAFDFMVKPVDINRLVTGVKRALEVRELRMDYSRLRSRMLADHLENPEAFADIVTNNTAMHSIFRYVETIATSPRPVLITGETGVGKELFARVIHNLSGLTGDFVAVNVAGLEDSVFSDTLFGHQRGAFTGADEPRDGMVERAKKGTLFLDEIGDLSQSSQVKLLRLLQEREYYPLGSDVAKRAEVRVVATTHKNLKEMRESGIFRKDLYFRLKTHHVQIPPLRERIDDIPLLVETFLKMAAEELNKKKPTPPTELFTLLGTYQFPGNIRELKSMIYDAVSIHSSRKLSMNSFKQHIKEGSGQVVDADYPQAVGESPFRHYPRIPTIREANQMLIDEAFRRANGNQTIAASLLGITQSALSKRLKRSGQD